VIVIAPAFNPVELKIYSKLQNRFFWSGISVISAHNASGNHVLRLRINTKLNQFLLRVHQYHLRLDVKFTLIVSILSKIG